jgi:anaerobic selenocysteine-containing dehydrogenase
MTGTVMVRTPPRGDRRCLAVQGASRCLLDALCQADCACGEAPCGLAVAGEGAAIVPVHGDTQEPFSCGFSCPQAYGVQELDDDPDRLRPPVRRTEPS